jgi:hypothetical protein
MSPMTTLSAARAASGAAKMSVAETVASHFMNVIAVSSRRADPRGYLFSTAQV